MTKKKHTNPTMTPEWFEALLNSPSMKGTSAEMDERAIPRDTEGNPLPEAPGHRKELEEGLPMPDGSVAKARQSTAPPPYVHDVPPEHGGGGMSERAIELEDMRQQCKDLLDAGVVTKKEVGDFAESLFRLIRKGG